jgi:hypothetical protein
MSDPHVLSFSTNDKTGKIARFTVGTDIIDYIESSRTFGREDLSDPDADGRFQRRMVAIPDKKGNVVTPMMLTISNQNQLYLVRKDDESKNVDGWKLIDLSQAFKGIMGKSLRVRAHAAAWTDNDRIAIAVAVDDGSSEHSRVFVAYNLNTRTSDWENIAWIDCGSRENIRVEGIRVLDGGDGIWTIVLVGDRGPNDTLYLLRSNVKSSFAKALVFNPAVTLEEILDFEVAVHPILGCGIAILGTSGGKRNLSFRPFPEYKADGSFQTIPPVELLPCPAGANVLETGLTKQIQKGRRKTYFGSDIYIGGQGIHLIKSFDILQVQIKGGNIPLTLVASPDVAPNVQDLIVGEAPDGSTSVWSLLQNGDLNIVKKAVAADAWGQSLRLRVGVQAIAPVHGDEHLTTSLLMVYANGQASFLVREASQGIWQERPLAIANPQEVTKVTCYGTTLRVLDDAGIPKPGVKVTVSASMLSSVVLNSNAVFIGPSVSVETQTDFNGSISIFDRVRSLIPAFYRFTIDGIEESFDINPAASVHQQLQSITADDLRKATISTSKGKEALLSDEFRAGANSHQVDAIAVALNNLTKLTNSTNQVEGAAGVFKVSNGSAFSSTLQAPSDYRWGIQANANGIQILSNNDIDKLIHSSSAGEFFTNLGNTITDFFEGIGNWLGEKVNQGISFIVHKVEDTFEFICKIGEKVQNFAVKTWEQLSSALTWLWQQIKIGTDKVWEYLKFALNWEDIFLVKSAMVDVVDQTLRYFQDSVVTMKPKVEESFDLVIKQIDKFRTEAVSGQPTKLGKPGHGTSFLDNFKDITKGLQTQIDQATSNSVVAWITNKINELGSEIIEFEGPNPVSHLTNATVDFFTKTVADQVDALSATFEQIQADLVRLFNGKFPTLEDLNIETIKKVIVSVGSSGLTGLLTSIKSLVLRFLDLIKELIGVIHDVLFTKIRFPFIEKLVKLFSGDKTSLNTSFNLIDVSMLLCAIPATISYKVLFGKSPIQKGEAIALPFLGDKTITVQSNKSPVGLICSFMPLIRLFSKRFSAYYSALKTGNELSVPGGIDFFISLGFDIFDFVFSWVPSLVSLILKPDGTTKIIIKSVELSGGVLFSLCGTVARVIITLIGVKLGKVAEDILSKIDAFIAGCLSFLSWIASLATGITSTALGVGDSTEVFVMSSLENFSNAASTIAISLAEFAKIITKVKPEVKVVESILLATVFLLVEVTSGCIIGQAVSASTNFSKS